MRKHRDAVEQRRTVADPSRGDLVVPVAGHEPWLTPQRLASLVAVLVVAWATIVVVRALRTVLVMLLLALFLSFAIEPAVQFLARRGWRRGAATAAVFTCTFLVTAGVLAIFTPLLIAQVTALVRSVPSSIHDLNRLLAGLPFGIEVPTDAVTEAQLRSFVFDIGEELRQFALGAASNVISIGATAFGVLLQLFAVILVTFYLVADGPRARRALARPLPPAQQREMLAVWEMAVAKTGGYLFSRLLVAVLCAVLHALALVVLEVPYWLPLAIWVGLTSAFVPVVGTYLGGILLLIVAGAHQPIDALWLLAFIVIYQQVENYVLAPRVQARTMDIHPAVAFVSVLVGATLLGAVGALLALPAAAIIQALLSTYVRRHELIDELAEAERLTHVEGTHHHHRHRRPPADPAGGRLLPRAQRAPDPTAVQPRPGDVPR